MKISKVLFGIIFGLFFINLVSANWVNSTLSISNLSSIKEAGTFAPAVFYKDSYLYMIAGTDAGNFTGYILEGDNWIYNDTIVGGLHNVSLNGTTTPSVFYKDLYWYMITGDANGNFTGFVWNGTGWQRNTTIVKGIAIMGPSTTPSVFYKDSNWYLVTGAYGSSPTAILGYNWNGTAWESNATIKNGFDGLIGGNRIAFFNISSNWYAIFAEFSGIYTGYNWNGTGWQQNSSVSLGLYDIGTFPTVCIFSKNESLYLISGEQTGGLNGWFTGSTYEENSQTYNNQTTEGNTEIFSINIAYDTTYYPNSVGYLIYNNTQYSSTKNSSGSNTIFTSSAIIPIVSAEQNISFYWAIGLINVSGTNYFNSTSHNQSVINIGIDDCSVYSGIVLNYTLKDEMTQANMNGSIELNVQVYDSSGSNLIMNISKSYSNYDNAKICINQSLLLSSSQYSLYAQAKYWNDSYVTRYNYIQNFVMTNTSIPQHINLFDLETTLATRFLITYKGSNFLPISEALISINKQYLAEDTYKTVEIEKTDQYGQVTGWFDVNGKFQIIVSKDGTTLSTFNDIMVYCNAAVGSCAINLDASSEFASPVDFNTYNNLNYNEAFDKTTRIYTLTFSTIDSSVSNITIFLKKFDMYGNTTICTNTVTTSSGSLTCTVPESYNNITFIAEVYKDEQQISSNIYIISPNAQDVWHGSGSNLVIFLLGLFLTIPMMFIPSSIGVIIGTFIALGIAMVLFFIGGSIGYSILMTAIIAGGIIIWALRQRGAD